MGTETCIICDEPEQAVSGLTAEGVFKVDCARCGVYFWPAGHGLKLETWGPVRLSGFVRDQNAAGIIPTLTRDLIDLAIRRPAPGLAERLRRLLVALVEYWGEDFNTRDFGEFLALQGKSYSANADQVSILITMLVDEGFVKQPTKYLVSLTSKGLLQAEQLAARSS